MTRISIITATLNNAEGLLRTLQSVAAQTHGDIEHIVVDGNSTDDTAEVLRRFPSVRVISAPPAGVYDALNRGIDAATGDIVGTLHAGDTFTSTDILARVAQAMPQAGPDFIFGDIHYISTKSHRTVRRYSSADFTPAMLLEGFAPPHPSLYMRRDLARHPDYRYATDYIIAGDFDLFVRLFANSDLSWERLAIDMVEMESGGIATHWRNRLYINNKEKLTALRRHGYKASFLSICRHYLHIIKAHLK